MLTDKKLESQLKKILKNKVILITGGSGSIGSKLAERLLKYQVKSIRILDVNEHSLFKLKRQINNEKLRPFLGNILDKDRVEMATKGVDIIIHTAAVKNLEITEFNPIETVSVNISGIINLIKAVMKSKPEKFLNVSTDKAVEPTTLYGMTKQVSEQLINWSGQHLVETCWGTVRFGNVIESRGNVFEVWDEQKSEGQPITVTDPEMKRYFFHVEEAVECICNALIVVKNGEVIIPKMKSYKIKDLAKKISSKQKIIGLRNGEKYVELLMTKNEEKKAIENKTFWLIPVKDVRIK